VQVNDSIARKIKNELSEISVWLFLGTIVPSINTCRINSNLERIANAATQPATQRAEGGK
jgi:hypothetical protein